MPDLRPRAALPHRQKLSLVWFRLRDARLKRGTFADQPRAYGSVTVSGRQGLRIAMMLFWQSAWAIARKTSVTFTFWSDR